MLGPYPGSVAVTRLTGDGSLITKALAVVGLFVADVVGAVVGVAEDGLAAGRRLGERSHHAGDALIVRARYAAAVVALARRHVQHPKELAEIHSRASVYAGRPSRPKNPAVRNNQRVQISVCDVG